MRFAQISSSRYQLGVNLIEVMVAMAIGLFLVLGATTLFVSTKKTSNVDDSIARLQETARYALSAVETDVRMANYWGIKKDGADFDNKGAPAEALADSAATNYCGKTYAVSTASYIAVTSNGYGLPSICPAQYLAATSADTLTVRRVATSIAAASANQVQVCSTRQNATFIKSASATCVKGEIHNLVTDGYYIDQKSDQNTTIPSLRRKTLISGPATQDIEIIPGVEDMQIELGWDSGSGFPANAVRYVQPDNALLSSGRIVAVRVWLLIRADQPDYTFKDTRTYSYADRTGTAVSNLYAAGSAGKQYAPNDNYRRLLVSRTIFIRNVMGAI